MGRRAVHDAARRQPGLRTRRRRRIPARPAGSSPALASSLVRPGRVHPGGANATGAPASATQQTRWPVACHPRRHRWSWSLNTTEFACTSKQARRRRVFGLPSSTTRSSTMASIGPRTRNATRRAVAPTSRSSRRASPFTTGETLFGAPVQMLGSNPGNASPEKNPPASSSAPNVPDGWRRARCRIHGHADRADRGPVQAYRSRSGFQATARSRPARGFPAGISARIRSSVAPSGTGVVYLNPYRRPPTAVLASSATAMSTSCCVAGDNAAMTPPRTSAGIVSSSAAR